ncbi:hypothetical protein B5807_11857 [Epicoccum nigrum]|jgi:serine/threonine protein kinase|uniref:Protein kinase domain-containing protein n=1 Tax=Epicoccum nigrum TaxID=105696 RepID=A0A1Y2LHK3_EPING|nr:hypothetical protein B5807_11857 [Epicoccum nigrum]
MPCAGDNLTPFLNSTRQSQRDREQLARWSHCLASVVDHIHGIGIRHRDVKPSNILISNGRLLLADFGISSMGFVETLSTTMPDIARARISSHCASEVENGSSRGRSADIFSLGAVFLQMLVAYSCDGVLRLQLAYLAGQSFARNVDELQDWLPNLEQTIGEPDGWCHKVLDLCR